MRYLATHCHICSYFLKYNDKPWQAVLKHNKHIKLNSNVDSILTGIRRENNALNTNNIHTEGEGLIINLLHHLMKPSMNHLEMTYPFQH